jgi:hypothetical protein
VCLWWMESIEREPTLSNWTMELIWTTNYKHVVESTANYIVTNSSIIYPSHVVNDDLYNSSTGLAVPLTISYVKHAVILPAT